MRGPKDWIPGHSQMSKDVERYLKSVVLVGGEGEIDLGRKSPVYVAIVHDGSGFNPAAAIVVDQSLFQSLSHEVFEKAYEILEDRDLKDEARVKELQDEWGDRWGEILTEAYDGHVWTFRNPVHAASAILTDPEAKRLVKIVDPAMACEYCGEPEGVRLVHFDSPDPPARMCAECRQGREERG